MRVFVKFSSGVRLGIVQGSTVHYKTPESLEASQPEP